MSINMIRQHIVKVNKNYGKTPIYAKARRLKKKNACIEKQMCTNIASYFLVDVLSSSMGSGGGSRRDVGGIN